MAKITVAVGIPALNEEANIAHLLKRLLQQKSPDLELKKIIVVSDASTDKTIEVAKSVSDNRIKVLSNSKRLGQNGSQNRILEKCSEDVVVLLNADVLPRTNDFLWHIVRPTISNPKVGLVGAETIPVEPQTTIEKILFASHMWKNEISKLWNRGDNVLSCRGAARAFRKEFYQQLRWPQDVPEDAYSYFFCQKQGYSFVFNPKAQVFFRLPQNLRDHIKQSHRYYLGQKRLADHFGKTFMNGSYDVPLPIFVSTFISTFFVYHLYLIGYVFVMMYISNFVPQQVSDASAFDMAASSKKLMNE
jgi:cellulose synthase/poly-beta-1,6-N-acetylglucosamine synthase-like glycosyltransferase